MTFYFSRRLQLTMGPQEDYIETVFTCEGDFHDPHLKDRIEDFQKSLKDLLLTGKQQMKICGEKVENIADSTYCSHYVQ